MCTLYSVHFRLCYVSYEAAIRCHACDPLDVCCSRPGAAVVMKVHTLNPLSFIISKAAELWNQRCQAHALCHHRDVLQLGWLVPQS
jgi:hypothetical protein